MKLHLETKLIVSLLLASTSFGGAALAASNGGSCPGSSMNATQYHSGWMTASGQRFMPDGFTAAHRRLPFRNQDFGDQSPHRRVGGREDQ
jgi:hypothetical protein